MIRVPICLDSLCVPANGDEGCMATVCNEGAFDALDFVWCSAWDSCPIIEALGQEEAAYAYEREQYNEWLEAVMSE